MTNAIQTSLVKEELRFINSQIYRSRNMRIMLISIKTLSRHHCPGCCIDQDPQSTPLSRLLHRSRPLVDTTVQVAASIKTLSRHHCPGCCIDQDPQSPPLSRLLHRSRPSVDTTVQVAASIKTLSRHHCPGCCIDQDP